jgi:hypothetical protein
MFFAKRRFMRAKQVGALFAGMLLATACKKPVEEPKDWQRNVQEVQQLGARYPGFARALAQQIKLATAAMDEAKRISDRETATRRMSEASSLLTGGFVYRLGQMDATIRRVREKIRTATRGTGATDPTDGTGSDTVEAALKVINATDALLVSGAGDPTGAEAILSRADLDLQSVSRGLDGMIGASGAKAEAKAAPAVAGTAGAAGVAQAPTPPGMWKCKFCQRLNADSAKTCPFCGAPHSP